MMEGTCGSQLVQLIRTQGFNETIRIELATITSPPPTLRIQVDNMTVELEADDVIVAEYLTAHTRTVTLNGGTPSTLAFTDELKTGDRVIVASIDNGQTYVILDRSVIYNGA